MRVVRRNGYRLLVGGPVPPQASAITIGNTISVRSSASGNDRLIAHELVHVRQFRQHGPVVFLARYLGSYIRLRAGGYSHLAAYRRIPFEVEASWLSRLHHADELEPRAVLVADPASSARRSRPVRVAHQARRGPDRMWRRRQAAIAGAGAGAAGS